MRPRCSYRPRCCPKPKRKLTSSEQQGSKGRSRSRPSAISTLSRCFTSLSSTPYHPSSPFTRLRRRLSPMVLRPCSQRSLNERRHPTAASSTALIPHLAQVRILSLLGQLWMHSRNSAEKHADFDPVFLLAALRQDTPSRPSKTPITEASKLGLTSSATVLLSEWTTRS
jgi:hypothetical protein